ncbi:MAG: biotin-dependent carboxyltransferase family protein [Firmicutes bacterium]|nr:biotin-dependent carboxyltransferase family protein [Bacillota bacterium]
MGYLKIKNPGLLTTIQDLGRIGYQQYGIPVAGAMDRYALELSNILVGNNRYEACLEMTFMGAEIEFNINTKIAITGANMKPTVNGENIEMYKTIYINKGDILKFNGLIKGCRSYLAVSGGFDICKVMGSKSTYLRAKIGGLEGRKLKSGDKLKVNKSDYTLGVRKIPKDLIPEYKNEITVRVLMGPEEDRFTKKGINTFLEEVYTITNQSDRMGYRLDGEKIKHNNGADIISGGISFGAIQVPGHGEPIIMMADRQTTGGYTKIANVISYDLPYLAQLKPGDKVKFEKTDISNAQNLIKKRESKILKLIDDFKKEKVEPKGEMKNFKIKFKGKTFNVGVQEIR